MEPNEAQAAVAMIKTVSEDPEYLIIERAQNPGDPWSGQLAFPGGHREDRDKSLFETGIRETFEETGIQLSEEQFTRQLPDHQAGRGGRNALWVTPFLFIIPQRVETQIDTAEVSSVIWVNQSHLLDEKQKLNKEISYRGEIISFPAINIDNKILWGFTYMVFQTYLQQEGLLLP